MSGLEIRDNPTRHRFEADLGDGSFAVAEYKLAPGKIVFTHTGCRRSTKARASGRR